MSGLAARPVETLLAVDRGARPDCALQFHHIALAARFLGEPLAGHLALIDGVGGHGGEIERLVLRIDGAVEQHDRDLGVLGLLENRIPAGRHDRRDEDRVDALRDEGADRLIWFSCFCCASEIFRSTPRLSASIFETFVSAARQPDSDPTWENPTVILFWA